MIDHNHKPYLLEVNSTPSFSTDASVDDEIKFNLIKDMFILLNLNSQNKAKLNQKMVSILFRKIK